MSFFFPLLSENQADNPIAAGLVIFSTCCSKLTIILTHNHYKSKKLSVLTLLQVQHLSPSRHATALC